MVTKTDVSATRKQSKFSHNPLPQLKLIQDNSGPRRVYLTPEGNKYPSVTSVLGFDSGSKEWLKVWREKVGEEEARRVSARSAARGTRIHSYCEDYLNNKYVNVNMFDLDAWKPFTKVLDRINNVRLLEGRMYSDKLGLAGTVDLIAEFDGVLSVIDFKTSKNIKSLDEIQDYFIQTTAYACMAYERYGLEISTLVILMVVDDDKPIIFTQKLKPFLPVLLDTIERYKNHILNENSPG